MNTMFAILGLVFLSLVLFLILVKLPSVSTKKDSQVDDGEPMPLLLRRILVGFLLVFGAVIVWILASAASLDFPEAPVLPEAAAAIPSNGDSEVPALLHVFPQCTLGSTPTVELALYGSNFVKESTVWINARQTAFTFIETNLLTVLPPPAALISVGLLTIEIKNPKERLSNAITVRVVKPKVSLNILGFHTNVTREIQLLLLALFAGALGSYIHALKSLTDFIGNRTLIASWFWWYITRPFLGMAMALIFYALVRAGLLAGTPTDGRIVSAFGVIAIGALVGMFADQAALKLAEIFDTLFRAQDKRGGKLDAPVVDSMEPSVVPVNPTQPVVIKLKGDRLGKVNRVRLNAVEYKPDKVSEKEITFTVQPKDLQNKGRASVSVLDEDGTASSAKTLFITDLAITTATLPDVVHNTPYNATVAASGGTPPYVWAIESAPAWLAINSSSGQISGMPPIAGPVSVTVKVLDHDGAIIRRKFQFNVT